MVNPQTSESPTTAGTNRRKHGDGTIRTTPSGRFEVRWREPDPDNGEVKRRSRNFTDHDAAEQFLAERLMALRVDDGLDDLYTFITGQGRGLLHVWLTVVLGFMLLVRVDHRMRVRTRLG